MLSLILDFYLLVFRLISANQWQPIRMEKREDFRSMLQYLPLVFQSSSLVWPPSLEQELQTMSTGPSESMVISGEALALRITSMRRSLSLNVSYHAPYASQGYALFFDEVTILLLSWFLFVLLDSFCLIPNVENIERRVS